jgi:hypothetical protein
MLSDLPVCGVAVFLVDDMEEKMANFSGKARIGFGETWGSLLFGEQVTLTYNALTGSPYINFDATAFGLAFKGEYSDAEGLTIGGGFGRGSGQDTIVESSRSIDFPFADDSPDMVEGLPAR